MNEPLPPPLPGSAPPPPPPYRAPRAPIAPGTSRGSLLKGLVLGWVAVIGGYAVLGAIATGVASVGLFDTAVGPMLLVLFGVAPWLGLVAWLVYYAANGEPRTAGGFALAVVSLLAVGILLVAACFAMLAGTSWH